MKNTDNNDNELEYLRQDFIEELTNAFSMDILNIEQYESLTSSASMAKTIMQLEHIKSQLPSNFPAKQANRQNTQNKSYYSTINTGEQLAYKNQELSACIMGERHLSGDWLSSNRVSSFTIMGSTKLDLRETLLAPGPTFIEVFTVMGETQIIVPKNIPVKMKAFAFMGESRTSREVSQQNRESQSWIEVSGFVFMGSILAKAKD